MGKNTVTLNLLVDDKLEVMNYNVFYIPKLEYNLYSIGKIEKASKSILAKKWK